MSTQMLRNNTRIYESRAVIWIFILMATVISISVLFLSKESLRLDESQSLWQTSHTIPNLLHIIALDVHVPFYHVLLHYWEILFGNDVISSRMLSLIFFVLAIPAMYLLGVRAYEHRGTAVFGAALLALSPFMNWYGNEIRMYSLFVLLSILSHYFFLGIQRLGNQSSFVMYVVTAVLGVFTHYFFFLILGVQFVFFLTRKETFPPGMLRKFIITALITGVSLLPWAYYVWSLGWASNSRPLLPTPDSINVFNAIAEFFIGFQKDYLNAIIISSWPLSVLIFFLALRKYNQLSRETWYFIFSAFIPIVIVFLASVLWRPLYASRYLIFTAPALYLVAGAILNSYTPAVARIFRFSILAVMVTMLSIQLLDARAPVKENYREATAYLNSHVAGDDIVIVSAPFTIYPVEYYYRGPAVIKTFPEWDRNIIGPIPPFTEETFPTDIQKITNGYRRMWVVLSYDQGYEEKIHHYLETHYQLLDEREFSKGLTVYSYQLRYD